MPAAVPSFLTAKMKTSILMNGVLVPFNRSIDNLQRFCRPVFMKNVNPTWDVSIHGSSFLISHRGRNMMVCSRHQLANTGRAPDELMIIIGDGDNQRGVTPSMVAQASLDGPGDPDISDMLFAEFRSPFQGVDLGVNFYDLDLHATADLRQVPRERITLMFTVGYPRRFTDYDTNYTDDYEATDVRVVSRWVKVYLELAEPLPMDRPGLVPLQVHSRYDVRIGDPDGFSGSPVFFLYLDHEKQSHLGFAGMVTFAAELGRFNMVEATHIRAACDLLPPCLQSARLSPAG